jgi:hypothetical protein
MDAEYLRQNVGETLAQGLTHTVLASPDDPVEVRSHTACPLPAPTFGFRLVATWRCRRLLFVRLFNTIR